MSAVDPALLARVERASRVLSTMLPTLGAYASAMIGRPVPVVVGERTQTSGAKVWIRPPLELAEVGAHDGARCGKRDGFGTLTCPACRATESVLVRLRHEIAHHVHGSFVERAFMLPGDPQVFGTLDEALRRLPAGAQALGKVLEDVRIDRATCDADPYGAATLYAFHARVVTVGHDETAPVAARELPLPAQVTLALLTMAVGSDVADAFSPEALAVFDHPQVAELVDEDFDAEAVPILAARLYEVLVHLGVFESEVLPAAGSGSDDAGDDEENGDHDEEDQSGGPAQADRSDESGEQESGDGAGGGEHGEDQGEESQGDPAEPGGPGGGGPAGADEGGGVAGGGVDPAEAEEPSDAEALNAGALVYGTSHLERCDAEHAGPEHDEPDGEVELATRALLEHVHTLGEVSGSVGRVIVNPPDSGRLMRRGDDSTRLVDDTVVGSLVGRARRVFSDNAAVRRTKGQVRGRVEPTLLGRRAWNPDDARVFGSRVRPNAPSYTVLVGMDDSYSTEMFHLVRLIRSCVDAMAQLCERTGVDFSVYAHTTGEVSHSSRVYDLEVYELKTVAERWAPQVRSRLGRLAPGDTNLDGSTLRLYRRRLMAQPGDRRILLYFTDGAIPGAGGVAEEEVMRSEVTACARAGITLLGVGIRTRSPEDFGIPTVSLDGPGDVAQVLEFLAHEFGV